MINFIKKNKESGQILMESVIAITMILVSLLGILMLLTRSIRSTRDVSNRLIATHFAVEGVEIVKNLIDGDVSKGIAWNSTVSSGQSLVDYKTDNLIAYSNRKLRFLSSDGYNYILGTNTIFEREINVIELGTTAMRIQSFVRWKEGSRNMTVHLEDVFYNWRKKS